MSRSLKNSAVLVLLLSPAPCLGADDPAVAVREVLETQVRCWNRGDLDGFTATYWNSPRLVFQSGGDRTDGFDAMRERYRKRYQAEGRAMGKLEAPGREAEITGSAAALARGR
ncbi:MAG: hypothetical protein U0794_23030, partial [Isosphaeraceae bacterium]